MKTLSQNCLIIKKHGHSSDVFISARALNREKYPEMISLNIHCKQFSALVHSRLILYQNTHKRIEGLTNTLFFSEYSVDNKLRIEKSTFGRSGSP